MTEGEEFVLWVGVDLGSEIHRVVARQGDEVVLDEPMEHSGQAISQTTERLVGIAGGRAERIAVAVETPRGAVVETFAQRGMAVYSINPKQLDRFRDRHSPAGAKDDGRDALVLAISLRTDRASFRPVSLEDPKILELRELSRMEEELKEQLVRDANRLREQLLRFFPQVLTLCPAADEPWVWALLRAVPTPSAARRVRLETVGEILRHHRIRRVKAPQVLETLRTPPLQVAAGVVEAATKHIGMLRGRLWFAREQLDDCVRQSRALLESLASESPSEGDRSEHRDVQILQSLPGAGRFVVATVLAEASSALAQRDYHALRAHAGLAPVTRQSGKTRFVQMRYACNPRLRQALHHWARIAAQIDAGSKAYYEALRARRHGYARSLRSVGDRLLRILFALLRARALFDPAYAPSRLAEVTP